jgi:hypothetical protein
MSEHQHEKYARIGWWPGSDHAVFATALGIAQPLGARLEFFHVQVDPGEAVLWQPRAEFARGSAMREMMQRLE